MNRQVFRKKEIDKGCLNKLLNVLIELNHTLEDDYNEIHIYQDDFITVVEWEQVPFNGEYGGKFEYIDEEHLVLKEVRFPDNHIEWLKDGEEEEALKDFLKEHPEYTKDEYGFWVLDEKYLAKKISPNEKEGLFKGQLTIDGNVVE